MKSACIGKKMLRLQIETDEIEVREIRYIERS